MKSNKSIVILGSLNAKEEDRNLCKEDLRSVQLISRDGNCQVNFFNDFGSLGISSLAWSTDDEAKLIFTTGSNLYCLNLETQSVSELAIPDLRDIHEIVYVKSNLYIANTGYDEIICYSPEKHEVISRISLSKFRALTSNNNINNIEENKKDTFHCNQFFKGLEGDDYALVHNVSGKQGLRRIADKIIKMQGNGGVINLTKNEPIVLDLKGPHTARILNEEIWICDSGNSMIKIYNNLWKKTEEIRTRGWGRGAVFDLESDTYFVGISALRKRYLSQIISQIDGNVNLSKNYVQEISISKRVETHLHEIESIEQINNVYLLSEYQVERLKILA